MKLYVYFTLLLAALLFVKQVEGQRRNGSRDRDRDRSRSRSSNRSNSRSLNSNSRPSRSSDERPERSSRNRSSREERDPNRNGCTRPIVRKEIRELTNSELEQLHEAFNGLKENGKYDEFCKVHLDNVPFAHSTPYFLVWHREFIFRFEQELRRLNPSLTLPYWDWSLDSQAPERSVIFTPRYFGTQGGRCLTNSEYRNWQSEFPNPHCLGRSFDGGDVLGAFYSPELLRETLDDHENYDSFRQAIEGPPHGNVHNNIGGDMASMGSCNDPLFYLHHAMVDKLYYDWQQKARSNLMSFGGVTTEGREADLDDELTPFNKPVGATLNVRAEYCYTYSDSVTPPRRRRSSSRNERRSYPLLGGLVDTLTGNTTPAPESKPVQATATTVKTENTTNKTEKEKKTDKKSTTDTNKTETKKDAKVNTPGPFDRQDQEHLRTPQPLPDSFIEMMGLNKAEIRKKEAKANQKVKTLNESGYKSPYALGVNGLLKAVDSIVNVVGKVVPGETLTAVPAVTNIKIIKLTDNLL